MKISISQYIVTRTFAGGVMPWHFVVFLLVAWTGSNGFAQTTLGGDHIVSGSLNVGTSASPGMLSVAGESGSNAYPTMSVIGDGGAIFAGTLGQGSTEIFSQVTNSYLLWYPNRGAIRGGAAQPYPTGLYSIAFGGAGLSASGDYSVAFGESGEAYGLRTFAVNGLALGTDAIGIGRGSYANGDRSVALGTQSLAIYDGSVAVGDDTFSNGVGSAAIGTGANAHGNYSVAVGNGVWSEDLGIALGHSLMAGGNSIALGISSVAFDYSIALGVNSLALGSSSIVIGRDLVAGYQTVVIGAKNVPEGSITEWVETDPLFVVGNGRESPSNAFVILKNGDVRIPKRQGDILMGEFGN